MLTLQQWIMRQLAVLGAIAIWLGVVGGGFAIVWAYAMTPGKASPGAAHWPADTMLRPAPHTASLIMFAHPRCPCTGASLAELAEIVRRQGEKLQTRVLFFEPAEASDDWRNTANWRLALSIAGIEALPDPGGREARRFGSHTSGQVFLYDVTGRLVFAGGITPLRGEQGDNPGSRAIYKWLSDLALERLTSDVFGCPLESVH